MADELILGSVDASQHELDRCELESSSLQQHLSPFAAFLILSKINWGIGMMAMPYFLYCAGLWFGILFFVFSMLLAADSSLCLTRCQLSISKCSQAHTYAQLVRSLLGRPGEIAVIFSLALANWGSAVAFIKFIGDNLATFLPEAKLSGVAWVGAISILVLLCAFVDDVRPLERFSAIGLLAGQAFAILLVGQALLHCDRLPAYISSQPVVNWSLAPVAMGLAVFCNEGMVIMTPPVHRAMKAPSRFPTVLVCMITYFTTNYMLVAVSGDFVYGYVTRGTVKSEVSLSFDTTPLHRVAVYFYVLQLIMSLPLILFAFYSSLETAFFHNTSLSARRCLRAFLILCAALVAAAIPHFGDFLAVTGGIGNSIGIYMLPHMCLLRAGARGEIVLSASRRCASWAVIALFGIVCGLLATVVSVEQLFRPTAA